MLDGLYKNVGGKIKGWAKGIFIFGSIATILTGIIMMSDAPDIDTVMFMWGLLIAIFGPFAALIFSWFIYLFGEIGEDLHAMRYNKDTAEIMTAANTYTPQTEQKVAGRSVAAVPHRPEGTTKPTAETPARPTESTPVFNIWCNAYLAQGQITGSCEMCGKKREKLVHAEFTDYFGKAERAMCYDCFSKRDCTPKKFN